LKLLPIIKIRGIEAGCEASIADTKCSMGQLELKMYQECLANIREVVCVAVEGKTSPGHPTG
jgi:hypothetical protein